MANYRDAHETEILKSKILLSAAKLFLQKGFADSTVKEIASGADINPSTMMYVFKSKEDIICALVEYVLKSQFEVAKKMSAGRTNDKILFYAAETTLQLYMAESSEQIRELYYTAYSLPKSTNFIQHSITAKLIEIFKEHLPNLEPKDFYELEIASGGVMRNFMTVPCDMYFTMERKVKRFLETTFLIYRVPDEKTEEAIEFVSQFDFKTIAQNTIDSLLAYFEQEINKNIKNEVQ